MALVGWKKEYETGIESVDEEHKELLALINETTAKLRADLHTVENIESYLGEIHAKISAHFALEERFMALHLELRQGTAEKAAAAILLYVTGIRA